MIIFSKKVSRKGRRKLNKNKKEEIVNIKLSYETPNRLGQVKKIHSLAN